jgi:hypothetical protein
MNKGLFRTGVANTGRPAPGDLEQKAACPPLETGCENAAFVVVGESYANRRIDLSVDPPGAANKLS